MSVASDLVPAFPAGQATALAKLFGKAPLTVYATGTAYTLTATSAAVDFGTIDPVLVIDKPGTYLLTGSGVVSYVGATFAASRTITIKLRRTNNTAADIASSSLVLATAIVTTVTETPFTFNFPNLVYTTTSTTDSLTIFADVSVIPTAGSCTISAASIQAFKLY